MPNYIFQANLKSHFVTFQTREITNKIKLNIIKKSPILRKKGLVLAHFNDMKYRNYSKKKNALYWLIHACRLSPLSCASQNHLPRRGPAHRNLSPPTLITNEGNVLYMCLYDNLVEVFSLLWMFFPGYCSLYYVVES